jgi:hypothetical protein
MSLSKKPACACGREHFARREDQDFSSFEQVVLDLSRFMLNIFGYKDSSSWMQAMDLAEQAAGAGDGPVVLARVTAMIRAVVHERPGTFHYLSPCCLHISDHEIAMMQTVQKARGGDWKVFGAAAQALVQGQGCERTKLAIVALVSPLAPPRDSEDALMSAISATAPSTSFH